MHIHSEAERRLRLGHPWLYREAIRKQRGEGVPGDLAAVYDRRDRFLALGLYDPTSPIRTRILQRYKPAEIDARWFAERLAKARYRRQALIARRDTTAYRLVHGENDGLPGLVLDQYDRTLVLKLYTAAWIPHLGSVLEAVGAVIPSARIVLRLGRAVHHATPHLHGCSDGLTLLGKPPSGPVGFLEHGLRFEADVVRGHKTGFFLDQRDNRARIEPLSRGRTVLDVFAYTGAFSVHAARGGAVAVTSVEMSRAALQMAARHYALNRTYPAVAKIRHRFIDGEAFKMLEQLARRRERFGLVLLDPPAFAKTKAEVRAALAAYAKLVRLGLRVAEPGGVLCLSSCTGQVSAEAFFAVVHRAAGQAGWSLRELARTGHPIDHPVAFPEGDYLKGLIASCEPLAELRPHRGA
ncbi:MAG: class I SAM-dependent methyltransferase [Candidatus Omnitrophica bacterium]|nr:class I SAM-dependent methyltransferase [Candidatus Omnitrophota bacterium]